MPLLRGMARTAVVAGTATAVSNRVSRRQANKWAEQDQYAPAYMSAQAPPQQYAEPAPAPPPAAAAPDPIEQLRELGELHQQGVLTDEEFTAQKAKVLGQ
jgi:putative oligomerization/nucleic acid binding protein